jgi:Tol biopolymer transport system component
MKVTARRSRHAVSLFVALLAAAVPASTAQATFPGANGRIAFTSERQGNPEIYSMAPNGSSVTRLTELASDDRSPAWNFAATDIAFATNRGADSLGDFEIYRMLASGAGPSALTDNAVPDSSPAWAPDGTRLVIVRHGLTDTELVIVAADGTGTTTPLTESISSLVAPVEPDWAANGNRIAFAAIPGDASSYDIFTINPDGTGLTNVTNTPTRDEREPSWSPDSAQIAYSGFAASNYEIRRIGADGTGDFQVTNNPGADDRQPAWSPDGQLIAYVSRVSASGHDDIFRIGATGGSVTRLTSTAGPDIAPDWQRLPPPACSDGVDNDGDTQIDFPADPGCTSGSDTDETDPPPTACSDGIDNDGDARIDYPADPGCTSAADNDEFNPALSGAYVRPKHASPVKVALVPTFNTCTSPNRQHGPPLAFPSCNPPAQASTAVTVGTPETNTAPENSVGSVKLTVDQGTPGPPEDSDIVVMGSVSDVRCIGSTTACGNANAADGADYTGQLQGNATVRITDRWNAVSAGGGADGATVVDIPFPMPFTCANTADPDIGGLCTANTSINGIVPGAVKDGKRAVWEVGQVFVNDGGPDGDTTTVPNTRFMTQGIFVP